MSVTATASPESPPGLRAPRRSWRDPRLVAGLALVLLSAVAVGVTVRAADQRIQVWSTAVDLPAGTELSADHLVAVPVRVPSLEVYLPADEAVPPGTTVTRDFAAGELLTRPALREPGAPRDLRVVTLPVLRNQMPADLDAGDRVDVYLVARDSGGEPEAEPRLVLPSVMVNAVNAGGSGFGATSLEVGVELSVSADDVAALVDAQARGTVTLVDVPVGAT